MNENTLIIFVIIRLVIEFTITYTIVSAIEVIAKAIIKLTLPSVNHRYNLLSYISFKKRGIKLAEK